MLQWLPFTLFFLFPIFSFAQDQDSECESYLKFSATVLDHAYERRNQFKQSAKEVDFDKIIKDRRLLKCVSVVSLDRELKTFTYPRSETHILKDSWNFFSQEKKIRMSIHEACVLSGYEADGQYRVCKPIADALVFVQALINPNRYERKKCNYTMILLSPRIGDISLQEKIQSGNGNIMKLPDVRDFWPLKIQEFSTYDGLLTNVNFSDRQKKLYQIENSGLNLYTLLVPYVMLFSPILNPDLTQVVSLQISAIPTNLHGYTGTYAPRIREHVISSAIYNAKVPFESEAGDELKAAVAKGLEAISNDCQINPN